MDCEKKLNILMELGKVISKENDLDSLLINLSNIARDIVDGDRASIFIYDPIEEVLWTKVAHGVEETIKIPSNTGIAGFTISSRKAQIVTDAYEDPRFLKSIDTTTGYKTKKILTVPMINMKKKVIGVFQILNKKNGVFTESDGKMILLLADYAASILENALLYKELESAYKKKTKELEKSEEKLKVIALTTNDGVWDWDLEKKEIIFSQRFYQMLGFTANELGYDPKKILLLVHKDDKKILRYAFKNYLNAETFKCQLRMRTNNGDYKWVTIRSHGIINEKNKLTRVLGAMTDISDIKEQEKKLQNAYNEIENLLKDQDAFIKNAIHEINTPISIINTYLEVLEREINHPKYFQRILSATKTLSSIYDDFNYFINKDKNIYQKELINLSSFILERAVYFEDIAEANNQQIISHITKDIFIQFSKIELLRIVDNTISNAIKYNKEQKKITITLRVQEKKVLFSVEDEGRGIADPQKVFQRYYREKNHKGGFGIGLTVVKTICDKNQVDISVYSKVDEGTTFQYLFKEKE